ncbi:MAG TPA: bacterial transcriptional activator domain-containing protein [Candidatus Saccharimonadales bacterium]|nr:bacterial transcriptional activator domain-containing protein [Candidatus Saccharimonadales bacterium]
MDDSKPVVATTSRWYLIKRPLGIACIIIAIMAIVVVSVYAWNHSEQTKQLNIALQKANSEINNSDQTGAPVALLLSVVSDAHTRSQKVTLYDMLATAEANNGAYLTAIHYYTLKHQLDPGTEPADALLLASIYYRAGDMNAAAAQYHLGIQYLQSQLQHTTNPTLRTNISGQIAGAQANLQGLEDSSK